MTARVISGDAFVGRAGQATGGSGPALPGPAQALLDAVTAISSELDLTTVLTRIVEAAAELTGARCGALGVLGPDGDPVDLVTSGADARRLRLEDVRGSSPTPDPATSLRVPITIRGTAFGNLYLTEKAGGTPFTEQDELLVNGLATVAAFVIENARAHGRSERRRRWLEASSDLTESLQPPVPVEHALRLLARTVRTVSGAAAVAVIGGDDPVRVAAASPADLDAVTGALATLGTAGGPAGDEPALRQLADLDAVLIPLRARLAGRWLLVALFTREQGAPDIEDRELLATFADQAALALDRLTAVADRQELAVVSDRERIARDLHDTVIQRLFATGLQLQATAMLAGSPQVTDLLERAMADLDLTIRDIRGTIFELRQASEPA